MYDVHDCASENEAAYIAYLTLSGLLGENSRVGWMKSRDAAERAQVRAQDRVAIETNGA